MSWRFIGEEEIKDRMDRILLPSEIPLNIKRNKKGEYRFGKKRNFKIKYVWPYDIKSFGAQASYEKGMATIKVNIGELLCSRPSLETITAIMLHEIGHFNNPHKCPNGAKAASELKAHIWALDKANRCAMSHELNHLLWMIKSWYDYQYSCYYQNKFNRHAMAYKMGKRIGWL